MDEKRNVAATTETAAAAETAEAVKTAETEGSAETMGNVEPVETKGSAETSADAKTGCRCGTACHKPAQTPGVEGWSVWRRVAAIIDEVGTVPKNLTVKTGSGTYAAVAAADVYRALRHLFRKYGITVTDERIDELARVDTPMGATAGGSPRKHRDVLLRVTYRVTNVDAPEDFFRICGYGEGQDTSDKGYGKALTYALKGALGRLFCIATGDDPDEPQGLNEQDAEALRAENQRLAEALEQERAKAQRQNGLPSRSKAAVYIEACFAGIEDGPERLAKILQKRGQVYPVNGLSDLSDQDLFGLYTKAAKWVADGLIQPPTIEQAVLEKAEPAKVEPAKAEPAKVEPTKAEPTKAEPTKAEPAKAESTTRPNAPAAPATAAVEPEDVAAKSEAAEPEKAAAKPAAAPKTSTKARAAKADPKPEPVQEPVPQEQPAAVTDAAPAPEETPGSMDPDSMNHEELVEFVKANYDEKNQATMARFYKHPGEDISVLPDAALRAAVRKKLKAAKP